MNVKRNGAMMLPYFWIGPVQLIIVAYLLFLEFGTSFCAGLGMFLFIFIIQQLTSRIFGKMKLRVAECTDKRTHLMNEIIASMRVIKMYCWEQPYTKIIAQLRKQEIRRGVYSGIVEAENYSFCLLSAKLVTFVTVAIYVMTGNILTPQNVFKLVAWTEVVRYSVTFALTLQMLYGSQGYFAAQRVQKFLISGEVFDKVSSDTKSEEPYNITTRPNPSRLTDSTKLCLRSVHASWPEKERNMVGGKTRISAKCKQESSSSQFSLRDINLSLKQGELVACVGTVGSGKSSLLLAILDQMPITSGDVSIDGDMAYVPQEAWVFSGTFRENLLFGCPMDRARYDKTISMCSLKPDIDLMPSKDLSLVGERGLSLSGGQKTRLNLARAVYRNADVYLLDDPLSAVDSKVGHRIFQQCIRGYLKDKTRLLVTHQRQYLKDVDRIIVLQDGTIHASGTYRELEGHVDFSHHLEHDDQQQTMEQGVPGLFADKVSLSSNKTDKSQMEAESPDVDQRNVDVTDIEDAEQIEEEERLKGTVGFSVYRRYWQAGNGWLLFTILLVISATNKFVFIFVDWWIASWSDWFIHDYERLYNVSNHEDDFVPSESYDYLYTYTGLVAGLLLFSIAEAVVHVLFTRFAARNLHNAMFSIVMRAPLKFFERNPVGRVLNRFSRDMIFIDEMLPQHAFFVIINLLMTLATVVFVSIVNPWVLLFTLPLVIVVIFIRNYGMRTMREIKRMEALNRSPVFSHITASLQGMSVIRAYKMEAAMTKHFDQLQDKHTASWFLYVCAYRWLGVRFDAVTGIYLCCVVYAGLLLADRQSVNGTLISLSLGYIFSLLGVLQFAMKLTAELESYFNQPLLVIRR